MIMRSAVGRVALASLLFLSGLAPVRSYAYAEEDIDMSVRLEDASASNSEIRLGDHIGRSFVITPVCDKCFVRLRAWLCLEEISEQVDYSPPKEEGWFFARDGWWYQKEPIDRGDSISFTSDFVIDGSESFIDRDFARRERQTTDISEVVTASVIQAQAVSPDWASDDPWNISTSENDPTPNKPDLGNVDLDKNSGSAINQPSNDCSSSGANGAASGSDIAGDFLKNDTETLGFAGLTNAASVNEESLLPKEQTITIGSLPQTGDESSPLGFLIASSVFSAVALYTAYVLMKRKNQHENRRGGRVCTKTA